MLIKFEANEELVKELMDLTDTKTGSKACKTACEAFSDHYKIINELTAENNQLNQTIETLCKKIAERSD